MAKRYTDEFGRDAVRMATTSGLTRPQLSSDLGVGLSTLNKWVQQHQRDDLMSGPHEDVEKENTRLRKEVRLLREEREVLKKATIFFAGCVFRGDPATHTDSIRPGIPGHPAAPISNCLSCCEVICRRLL
jgi:transposase